MGAYSSGVVALLERLHPGGLESWPGGAAASGSLWQPVGAYSAGVVALLEDRILEAWSPGGLDPGDLEARMMRLRMRMLRMMERKRIRR